MTNIAKHLAILEALTFDSGQSVTGLSTVNRLEQNVSVLQKYIKIDAQDLLTEISRSLQIERPELKQIPPEATYCIYLEHVLLQIVDGVNFDSDAKEDLISTHHVNLCIEAVQDLSLFALSQQLHPVFLKTGVFAKQSAGNNSAKPGSDYELLLVSITAFRKILAIKQFHAANSMEIVLRDYIAAIFTLLLGHYLQEHTFSDEVLKQLQVYLNFIWLEITKMEYFRNILFLKGIPKLPPEMQKRLHLELLNKLMSKDGFTTLVATLSAAQKGKEGEDHNCKQTFEIIANIVAFKGHSKRFQHVMLQQIFKFFRLCVLNDSMMESMGAGLLSLRRLYDLNDENKATIKEWLNSTVKPLVTPDDLLSGLILMEHREFCLLVSQLFQIFCTSSVECLPSELLIPMMPLLLQVFHALPPDFLQKKQVGQLIARCLSNRMPAELHSVIGKLYKHTFDDDWLQLHERILIYPNPGQTEVTLKIASSDIKQDCVISLALPELLMTGDQNILLYQVFISLLRHMEDVLNDDSQTAEEPCIDLLQTEEELISFLNEKYPAKVEIILSLNSLVSHEGLKTQLAENSTDFLRLLRQLIEKRTNVVCKHVESADQTLLIMLTLAQEMLEYTQMPEKFRDFVPMLKSLRAQSPNVLVKLRIDSLLTILEGGFTARATQVSTPFNVARSLIESKESHLQVYGIQTLLDLLRRRDSVTLSNGHVIIALALTTLKNTESYTFLNCVRLFVGLVDVMEAEVLEVLSDEYLNDNASMDYRLVVGEAILKVSKELGPISYKYKDVLLNGFMSGARSPIDEFRWSSFSNLSQLCRTLSYQVHKFFHELINLVDTELASGKYLPAKRAAVLVISELLQGMENLMDFEEMLLPLYRVLRSIEADESCDDKMRLHAANGLKALAEKSKQFLFPQQQPQREIQIFGIKDKPKSRLKGHILEMN